MVDTAGQRNLHCVCGDVTVEITGDPTLQASTSKFSMTFVEAISRFLILPTHVGFWGVMSVSAFAAFHGVTCFSLGRMTK